MDYTLRSKKSGSDFVKKTVSEAERAWCPSRLFFRNQARLAPAASRPCLSALKNPSDYRALSASESFLKTKRLGRARPRASGPTSLGSDIACFRTKSELNTCNLCVWVWTPKVKNHKAPAEAGALFRLCGFSRTAKLCQTVTTIRWSRKPTGCSQEQAQPEYSDHRQPKCPEHLSNRGSCFERRL